MRLKIIYSTWKLNCCLLHL